MCGKEIDPQRALVSDRLVIIRLEGSPPGRAFLRRIIYLTLKLKYKSHRACRVRITVEARKDFLMWKEFLAKCNWSAINKEQVWQDNADIQLFTDASGSQGLGGYFQGSWFEGVWPNHVSELSPSITWMEFFPIVAAVSVWGKEFAGKKVVFRSDNQGVVAIISKQTYPCPDIMRLGRHFVLQCMECEHIFPLTSYPGGRKWNCRCFIPLPGLPNPKAGTRRRGIGGGVTTSSLESVAAEAQSLLQASLAVSTHRVYQRSTDAFIDFRYKFGLQQYWLAPCGHMVAFISALSLEGKAPSTIISYIAGVAYMHKVNNWQDPTKSLIFIIQKLIEGSKKLNGRPDGRAPLTLNVLVDVLNTLHKVCSSTNETLLFRSAFSLTFFWFFLRVGETGSWQLGTGQILLAVSLPYLTLHWWVQGKGLYKSVSRSLKLKKRGRSTTIIINRGASSQVCPINALERFLDVRPVSSGPLFIHMDKSPPTRFRFQSVLTSTLAQAGYPAERFKTHSFRIGTATTAAMCGFNSDSIKVLGRWRSNAFRVYIRLEELCTPSWQKSNNFCL